MKSFIVLSLGLCSAVLGAVPGFDISHYQKTPYDFKSAYSSGARFVLIKVCSDIPPLRAGATVPVC